MIKFKKISNNFNKIIVNDSFEFYFSYETIIAFKKDGKIYATKEKYSVTTSKHINSIFPNVFLEKDEFKEMLKEILKGE